MMKKRIHTLISFALVLVMLVTMLPMGVITANAEGEVSAELAAGLADIANTSEFVIKSVADWNAVAAVNNQFAGKTVKLGADIDAEGEALPQLFQASNAKCTFDGQGYTVKNVGTPENPIAQALLSWKACLNVYNLNVENCHVSGAGVKGVVVDWINAHSLYTYKNIKVMNSTVKSTDKAAGVIAGQLVGNSGEFGAKFENILVSGCSAEGVSTGGGWNPSGVAALAGYCVFNGGNYGASAKNIEVVNSTFTDTANDSNAAGLFGYYRMNSGVSLSIENVYVSATIKTPNASGWTGVGAGLVRTHNATGQVVTLKNCLTNNSLPSIIQNPTIGYFTKGNFTISDLFTVENRSDKTVWLVNSDNIVNGDSGIKSNYNGYQPEIVAADSITTLITRGADGFITRVGKPLPDTPERPEPTDDPSIPAETVINSVEDWNKVIEMNSLFTGKTVKLGADLDLKGETLDVLFFKFAGTFDGCGYTIKNVGTANNPNTTALIAYQLGAATVKNVNFENVHISRRGQIGMIACLVENRGTALVENVKLVGCTVTSTANTAGGLVGSVSDTSATASTTFKNVNLDQTSAITGNAATGGVIGSVVHEGTVNVTNVMTAATLTGTTETNAYDTSVGGLVGYALSKENSLFNVSNCLVEGVLTTSGGKEKGVANLSGLIGASEGVFFPPIYEEGVFKGYEGGTRTLNINSVIITCEFYTAARWTSVLTVYHAFGYFNYQNVYTKTAVGGDAPNPMWQFVAINVHACVNGEITKGELQTKDDMFVASPERLASLRTIDITTGFLTKIESIVEPYGCQTSAVTDGKYAIRFLGMAQMIEGQKTYVNVKATTASGVVKTFRVLSPLFERVTPFRAHGVNGEVVAENIGAEKLLCVTVYDIPVGEAVTFEYWMSIETPQGFEICSTETLTISFDANGALS